MAEMNAFTPSNVLGQRISGSNVLSVEFYSATADDLATPGMAVKVSPTTAGLVTKVAALAASTDVSLGVILSKPMKSSFAVGDIVEIGMENTILPMTAGGNFNAGTELEFNPTTKKVVAKSSGAKIGVALENGVTDALVRVMIQH
jgi:hypothetical protein